MPGVWAAAAGTNRTTVAAKRSAKLPMPVFMTLTFKREKQSGQHHKKFEHVLNRGRVGIEPASATAPSITIVLACAIHVRAPIQIGTPPAAKQQP
jgi:hypothetical protein